MTSRPRTRSVTERVHGGFGIDTTALHDLARDLRKLEGTTAREFRRGLREVGEVVAVEARAEASQFSSKIADTIKVRVAGATVEVRAGSPDVPEAVLLELGNVGSSRPVIHGKGRSVTQCSVTPRCGLNSRCGRISSRRLRSRSRPLNGVWGPW